MIASASYVLSDTERQRLEHIDQLLVVGGDVARELIQELAEPSWSVRRAVVAALGALGDEALPELVASLRSQRTNETFIAATVDAIVASAADVERALTPLADDPDEAIVADVAQILGRRQRQSSVPLLVRLAQHRSDNVAVAAIEALGRVGGRAAVEPLIAAVNSANFFRVFPAIDVLGRSGDPRAVVPLASLLEHRQYALEAARALGRTGERTAVPPLARLLLAPALSDVRVAAMALLDLRDRFERRYGVLEPIEEALCAAVDPRAASRHLSRTLPGTERTETLAIVAVLGMLKDPSGVPVLTGLLDVPTEGVGEAAAKALRRMGRTVEESIVEVLRQGDSGRRRLLLPLVARADSAPDVVRCLDDDDAEVRIAACEALARLGMPAAARALFVKLSDPNPAVVQAAVAAVQSLGGPESHQLALEAARSPSASVRRWGLRILAYFGVPAALDACLEGLNDPDARVRDSAIFGLPFVEDPRAREALFAAARDPVAKTRAAAARALGQCSPEVRVQGALLRALGDADAWVRYYACQSLGRLGAEAAAEAITRLLGDDAGQVRVAAVEALSHLRGDVAQNALSTAALAEDEDVRRAALIGLGIAARPEGLPVLLEAADDVEPATRLVALAGLAGYPDDDATRALARGAADPDEGVRNAAVGFLAGRAGDQATASLIDLARQHPSMARLHQALALPAPGRIPGIFSALRAADDELAPVLAAALARMGRPEAERALLDGLSLPHVPARKAAATTLAGMGTRSALDALRGCASHDPDPEVRRICALVLA